LCKERHFWENFFKNLNIGPRSLHETTNTRPGIFFLTARVSCAKEKNHGAPLNVSHCSPPEIDLDGKRLGRGKVDTRTIVPEIDLDGKTFWAKLTRVRPSGSVTLHVLGQRRRRLERLAALLALPLPVSCGSNLR
jgi:hypothetical protein